MSKRKREEEQEDGEEDCNQGNGDFSDKRRQNRLRAKFEISVQDLTSALKLARGFERQKLGRRQKQASQAQESHTLLRLREEVIVLKQLDLEKTARNYLLKTFSKIKRIRESAVFASVFGGVIIKLESVKPGAEANVLGRLCKSNPVKDVVDKAVTLMFKVLALQQTGQAASSRGETNAAGSAPEYDAEPEPEPAHQQGDLEDVAPTKPPQLGDVQEEEGDPRASFSSETSSNRSHSPSIGSPDHLDPGSVVDFLPSLGMTGYYSGSESSDIGDDVPTSTEPKARKNRRGQRARQQIAELKYGKAAKHLQKQAAAGDISRHAEWDPKRGAVDRSGNHHHRQHHSIARHGRGSAKSGGAYEKTEKEKARTKDDSGSLHPSWQAAKLRQQQQNGGQISFAGKKTTFD